MMGVSLRVAVPTPRRKKTGGYMGPLEKADQSSIEKKCCLGLEDFEFF